MPKKAGCHVHRAASYCSNENCPLWLGPAIISLLFLYHQKDFFLNFLLYFFCLFLRVWWLVAIMPWFSWGRTVGWERLLVVTIIFDFLLYFLACSWLLCLGFLEAAQWSGRDYWWWHSWVIWSRQPLYTTVILIIRTIQPKQCKWWKYINKGNTAQLKLMQLKYDTPGNLITAAAIH